HSLLPLLFPCTTLFRSIGVFGLRYTLPVYIECRIIVGPLSSEAHPLIKTRLGHIIGVPHMPFAKEPSLIPHFLEILRKEDQALRKRCTVVNNGMGMGILPC